jgi:serine/threonine protein kinase
LPIVDYNQGTVGELAVVYAVTQYSKDGSLDDWLRKHDATSLSVQDIAHLLDQAALALGSLHALNISHQDVKPSNFIIWSNKDNPGHLDLWLTDFWVAKFTAARHISSTNHTTPVYMAPEQSQGQSSPATDQYALAVVAYELLTGKLPFTGSPDAVKHAHVNVTPPHPSVSNSRIPHELDAILLRALAKKPADRYPSIADLNRDFRYVASSTASKASVLSRRDASLLLYFVLTGVIAMMTGIFLYALNLLPPLIANISSGIGVALTLISSIWGAAIENQSQRVY